MLAGLIDIPKFVKKYIHKLLEHEARVSGNKIEDVDIVIRCIQGEDRVFSYSRRDKRWIRELTDKMIEEILTKK